jgi:hypothetical protein
MTSFDSTPIVPHVYPGVALSSGERVPTMLVGPATRRAPP